MEIFIYLVTGIFAGLSAGLFGVGGGIIVVPVLSLLFHTLQFPPDHLMHLAIGTSLATIVVSSFVSTRGHQRKGNIDWTFVRNCLMGCVIGVIAGSLLAAQLHSNGLQLLFAMFECVVAFKLWFDKKPSLDGAVTKALSAAAANVFGFVVGLLSSMMGIGGGTVSIPIMLTLKMPVHRTIATSAAIGLPVAVCGTLGFICTGWAIQGLPQYSLGFVYLPAFIGITVGSLLSVSQGVALAYKLPVHTLKKLLAILLFSLGVKMSYGLL